MDSRFFDAAKSKAALILILLFALDLQAVAPKKPLPKNTINRIKHVVVIYAENRSFDNLYGLFPGANGISNATPAQYTQLDHNGSPLPHLPAVLLRGKPDSRFPPNLPNQPFQIDAPPINLSLSEVTADPTHRFYQNIEQINGGQNNRFAAMSSAGGLVMGYYDGSKLPMWKWAQEYVLADNFFMGAFGGSFLNHQWLVCACTPYDSTLRRIKLRADGLLNRKATSPASALNGPPHLYDGTVTPDGYVVNTLAPPYQPSNIPPEDGCDLRWTTHAHKTIEPQTSKTIGDSLSDKKISWAWYAQGWDAAVADGAYQPAGRQVINRGSIFFQTHHQPFNYFLQYAPGTKARNLHLKDGSAFLNAINAGKLPQVSFYKPSGRLAQHPGYGDILSGDQHIADIVAKIHKSRLWASTAIFILYDENGGFWDHVAPPAGDRWGPGTRVPMIVVSPFAKRGYVDHTQYDTTSIIKFITRRFKLEPLPGVRPASGDLTNAFL